MQKKYCRQHRVIQRGTDRSQAYVIVRPTLLSASESETVATGRTTAYNVAAECGHALVYSLYQTTSTEKSCPRTGWPIKIFT